MRVGGVDVITCKNKDKGHVYYPRGTPFYSRLSGMFTPSQGSKTLRTSSSCKPEIRRGDAICIDNAGTEFWFRVDSSIGRGLETEQNLRSQAPLSVTSIDEMAKKNVYFAEFTDSVINKSKFQL